MMQTSLNITTVQLSQPPKLIWQQTKAVARKSKLCRYLLIGGGIVSLPILVSISLLNWAVKQNWTMLPL